MMYEYLQLYSLTHFLLLEKVDGFPNILNLVDPQPPSACVTNLLPR